MKTDSVIFDGTQTVIGHGAQADVYRYHGYAYKVYRPDYNPEWIKFEKAQQSAVNETGLCNVRYYDTDDLYTVKMDLIDGETLEKKMREGFAGGFDILAEMFRNVHNAELDGVKMPGLIDWINARIAPAVFDYARTYEILGECAPEVLGMYEAAIASDMRFLGITDEDFADAVMVSQVIRDREKKD